jgi:hypothetical protein
MTDAPAPVDEVQRQPLMVVERTPDRVVVVDHHRVCDPHLQRATNVVDGALECELHCVHAAYDELRAICSTATGKVSIRPLGVVALRVKLVAEQHRSDARHDILRRHF